jgi:hypothetical protein
VVPAVTGIAVTVNPAAPPAILQPGPGAFKGCVEESLAIASYVNTYPFFVPDASSPSISAACSQLGETPPKASRLGGNPFSYVVL